MIPGLYQGSNLYYDSKHIPWFLVYTISPSLYHESKSIPLIQVYTMRRLKTSTDSPSCGSFCCTFFSLFLGRFRLSFRSSQSRKSMATLWMFCSKSLTVFISVLGVSISRSEQAPGSVFHPHNKSEKKILWCSGTFLGQYKSRSRKISSVW